MEKENNMAKDIYFQDEINSLTSCGRKAFNLNLLVQKGYQVPSFVAISTSCMLRHLKNSNEFSPLKEDFIEELNFMLARHFPSTSLFSVRSSSPDEDSEGHSFAGQFDTFLRVEKKDLPTAILKCWQSAFSPNVLTYYQKMGIPKDKIALGVIVQEMIESDFSGVAFSANPQGLLNESVIVCGRSTGDYVVEDKVPVTSYYYNQTDRLSYYETQGDSPLIEDELIDDILSALSRLAEPDSPIDVEFAIKDNQLYFLQLRPITTLSTKNPLVLDNSNIVESYPGLSLPLTCSFVNEVYYGVFRGLAKRCLLSRKLLEQFDETLHEMVGDVNGRIYYKISNWYVILKFLPFQKKIIPIWQKMLGVSNKQYSDEKNDISFFQRISSYLKILSSFIGIPKKMKQLNNDFLDVNALFSREFPSSATNQKLVELYIVISEKILKSWDITLLNDMYSFMYTGLISSYFKKKYPSNHEEITNNYIATINNIESMKPILALLNLADTAVKSQTFSTEIYAIDSDVDAENYLTGKSEYAKMVSDYITVYGDRSLEELKLETDTFRSSPLLLIKQIKIYIKSPNKLSSMLTNQLSENHQDFKVRETWVLRKLLKGAKTGIANREISRLNRSRIFGMVRSIFTKLGESFAKEGLIQNADDIFYLRKYEIFDAIKNDDGSDFISLVEKRKNKYQGFDKLPAYSRLIFSEKEFDKLIFSPVPLTKSEFSDYLSGVPCSNGIVEGNVVIITNAHEAEHTADKILVTKMTDPGWVFLLASAKGIISEKGSQLSHTAIISRELKIPSVVGVENATTLLQNGDYIRLNGNTGEIEVLSRAI